MSTGTLEGAWCLSALYCGTVPIHETSTSVGVHLLQYLVDIDAVAFPPPLPSRLGPGKLGLGGLTKCWSYGVIMDIVLIRVPFYLL